MACTVGEFVAQTRTRQQLAPKALARRIRVFAIVTSPISQSPIYIRRTLIGPIPVAPATMLMGGTISNVHPVRLMTPPPYASAPCSLTSSFSLCSRLALAQLLSLANCAYAHKYALCIPRTHEVQGPLRGHLDFAQRLPPAAGPPSLTRTSSSFSVHLRPPCLCWPCCPTAYHPPTPMPVQYSILTPRETHLPQSVRRKPCSSCCSYCRRARFRR